LNWWFFLSWNRGCSFGNRGVLVTALEPRIVKVDLRKGNNMGILHKMDVTDG
jgi:hypothetical protein